MLSHRIALDPTVKQAQAMLRACGVARFTWNWALAEWNSQYAEGGKPSGWALQRYFNSIKRELYPWVYESPSNANQRPFENLQKAYVCFFKGTANRPKFKKRGVHDSFYVANHQLGLAASVARLPGIGWVRTRDALRFQGKPMGATVSREADRWFLSVMVELKDPALPRISDGSIGIDLGLTAFAVTSQGESIQAPKPLAKAQKRLRKQQRKLARQVKGSGRRYKTKRKIARIHQRVKNIRKDFLHKLSTKVIRENQAVAIEDLNVKVIVKHKKLARSISDAGWGEFRKQLTYKARRYGTTITVAGRFYPSTKRCSNCGSMQDMPLQQRVFRCAACGFEADRDLNAALNLNKLNTLGLREIYARGQDTALQVTDSTSLAPSLVEARTSSSVVSP